jgi:hypothetical protein
MSGSSFTQTIALEGADEVVDQLDKVGDAGEKAFEKTEAAADGATDSLQSVFAGLLEAFKGVADGIVNAGSALGRVFQPFISSANSVISDQKDVSGGLKDIAGSASGASDAVSKIGREGSTWFAILKDAIASIGAAFSLITPLAVGAFAAAGFAALAFGEQVASTAVSVTSSIGEMATSARNRLQNIFLYHDLNTFQGWKNATVEFLEYLQRVFVEKFYEIKNYIQNIDWSDVWESVKASAAAAWDTIKNWATSAYDAIKAATLSVFPSLTRPWEFIEAVASKAWDAVVAGAKAAVAAFNIVIGVADQVANVVNKMFGTNFTGATLLATIIVAKFAQSLIPIPGWIQAIGTVMTPFVATFTLVAVAIKGAAGAIDAILGKFQQLTDALSTKLIEALRQFVGPELWDSLKSTAQAALAAVSAGIGIFADMARKALASVMDGSAFSPANLLAAWATIKDAATAAWAAIKAAPEAFFAWLDSKWASIKDGATTAWDGVKTAFFDAVTFIETKWDALVDKIKSAGASIRSFFTGDSPTDSSGSASRGAPASSGPSTEIGAHATGGFIKGPGSGTSDSILARLSNGEFVMNAKAVGALGADFFHALNNGKMPGFASGGQVGTRSDGMGWDDSIYGPTTDNGSRWGGDVIKGYDGNPDIIGTLKKAWSDLQQIGSKVSDVAGDLGSRIGAAGKFATGGLISGPGSGTSDSILARLSNGEFVMNAKAVGALGADFFHALNNGKMPGFAMGGMIGMPALASIPAFASGGSVGGQQRGDVISFPLAIGGQSFEVFAAPDTVRDLQRHSAASQMASATKRKPSWDR